jgi:hypothetical protein
MEPIEWGWQWSKFAGVHVLPYLFVWREGVMVGWLLWEFGYTKEPQTVGAEHE